MSDLPRPAPLPPAVPIAIEDEQITDEAAVEAMKRQGFVEFSATSIRDLANLGAHLHQLGTIRIQRGRAMVAQKRVEDGMKVMHEELLRIQALPPEKRGRLKDMLAVAEKLGFLAGKLTGAQELMVLMEGGATQITADGIADNVVPSFRPGATIKPANQIVAQEVHIHPAPNPTPR